MTSASGRTKGLSDMTGPQRNRGFLLDRTTFPDFYKNPVGLKRLRVFP